MIIDSRNALEQEMLSDRVDIAVAGQELRLLANIFRALRNNWKWLVLAGVLGAVVGGAVSFQRDEKFEATAKVMINTQILVETNFTPVESGQPISTTVLESEIEVLRSLDLVEKVVDQFNLVNDPEFNANALPKGAAAKPKVVTDAQAARQSTAGGGETSDDLILDANPQPETLPFDAVREEIIANVAEQRTIEQTGNVSAVYAITFTSTDPQKAAILANALSQEYISASRNARIKTLELSQGWLQARTGDLQTRLSSLSVQREEFLLTAPYSPEEVDTIKARNVSDSRQLSVVRQELDAVMSDIGVLQDILRWGDIIQRATGALRISPEIGPILSNADTAPDTVRRQIREQLSQTIEQLALQSAEIEARLVDPEAAVAASRAVLVTQAARDAELSRIENDIIVAESIYQDFVSQLSRRTQLDRYLDDDARIISAARPALDPTEPNRRLYATVAGVLATLLAFVAVVVSEIRQPKLRNKSEFETTTDLPFLGVVPEIKDLPTQANILFSGAGSLDPVLIRFARKLRVSLLSEAAARGQIGHSRAVTHSPQVIAGAAAALGEGQSTMLIGLAVAFAEANETVLYIEFLGGNDSRLDHANPHPESPTTSPHIPRLSFVQVDLPEKEMNETQVILELHEQLTELRKSYDRIILDAPPILFRISSAQICQAADEIVQVGRWNHTSKSEIRSALQVLSNVGVSPVGVVATRFDLSGAKRYGDETIYFQRSRSAL